MLYVVTTNYFIDGSQTLGVFTEKHLAVKAILAFVHEHINKDMPVTSDDYFSTFFAGDTHFEFMIDTCYPNVSLA